MASINKPPLGFWLGVELALLALVVGFAWLLQTVGFTHAPLWTACCLGGLLAIIPHAYFAYFAWRYTGARAAPWMVKAFYRGESGKFVMTLVGFGLIFASPLPVHPLALFVSYCLFLAIQIWLAANWTHAK